MEITLDQIIPDIPKQEVIDPTDGFTNQVRKKTYQPRATGKVFGTVRAVQTVSVRTILTHEQRTVKENSMN